MASVGSSSDSNYYREILRNTEAQVEAQEKAHAESEKEQETRTQEKSEHLYDEYQKDLNETVQNMRDHYEKRLGDAVDENRSDRKKFQEQATYDRNGRLAESQKELKQLKTQFEKDRGELERKIKNEQTHSEKRIEFYTQHLADQNHKDLEQSTQAHNISRENQRQMMQDEIRELKRALETTPNVQNSKLLSPEVEEHFTQKVANHYQKIHEAELEAHQGNLQSLHENYSERMRQIQNDSASRERDASNRHAIDDHTLRNEFMTHSFQIQKDKEDTINRKDRDHARADDRTLKTHANAMGDLQRNATDTIDNIRRDTTLALQMQKSQSDYNARVKGREHLNQVNTMRRDFDKQMSDTKEQYEQQINDLKQQLGQELRNKERDFKRELDAQATGYNERLSQNEAAQKERERLIHENYQDQIERMKRGNAINHKTKG